MKILNKILQALSRLTTFSLKGAVVPDVFTTKYVTAQIFDELGSWHVFPLKESYIIDGKFLVKIGNRLLLLRADLSKIKTYRHKAAKPVQTLIYSSRDYDPIDPCDLSTIESFCEINGIQRIDHTQALLIQAAKMLSKDPEQPIGFSEVIEQLLADIKEQGSEQYAVKYAQYKQAVLDLGTESLIPPLEPISEYLGARMQNNPHTLGNVITNLKLINHEWKAIANPAKSPFGHWLLLFGIIGIIAAIGVVGYYLTTGDAPSNPDAFLDQIKQYSDQGISPDELVEQEEGQSILDTDILFESAGNLSGTLLP